ncbi:MAG: 50S ribosomal protein L18 [Candidatus Geothermarchaeales archaeon]
MNIKKTRYIHQFRRRREAKTDYRLRKRLILSGLPLFTVRRSNNYIYVNFVLPEPDGDKTLANANSKELIKRFEIKSGKNLPAAYLTGLLAGLRAKRKRIKRAVLNLGPAWPTRASIPFAAVQGAVEAGIDIPIGDEAKVDHERIRGEHIASYAKLLEEREPDKFKERFSNYLEAKFDPKTLPERFDEIREALLKETE